MKVLIIVFLSLWLLMSINLVIQYFDPLKRANKNDRVAAVILFMIAAPFFYISVLLESLLNCLLPEDWDDEDFK